jgi:hypothetical protein
MLNKFLAALLVALPIIIEAVAKARRRNDEPAPKGERQ